MKRVIKSAVGVSPLWELSGVFRQGGCASLTYHRIGAARHGFKHIDADAFRQQMLWLREHCSIVEPSAFRDACSAPPRVRPGVLVTFDDGYRDYHDVAYPILRELRIPAVNFVATAFVDDPARTFWWDQVDVAAWGSSRARVELPWQPGHLIALDKAGRERVRMDVRRYIWSRPDDERTATLEALWSALDVGSADLRIERQVMTWDEIRAVSELTTIGGHTHTHPLMSRVDEPRLRSEVSTCRDRISAHTSVPAMFAYPSGAMSDTAKRVVREEGFDTAFSDERGFNDARTDWMAAKRINAPADVGQLGYLLSGLADRAPRALVT
jgi:peptidoglycan/xylan/chitin deacetylase (PgdA/CDA1 family)